MIRALLIANRGEIACRITRACRRMGIRAIAVYSEADRKSLHVRQADEAILLGPAPASESYLNVARVLEAARRSGADAVHPGFGFLAENAAFARAVLDQGLVFVGPDPEAIEIMGDKQAARKRVAEQRVPLLPAFHVGEELSFPLMVKAVAGGGGKGMRRVESAAELPEAMAAARREALAAFGSADLLLERALSRPRHIEVQILGDRRGRLVALGERECSVQRRHQKVIEEAPAPHLSRRLRQRLVEAALAAARSVNYHNAGTVEFLVEGDDFYFLEMNTRLQVEHGVTEEVTDIDLVEWQIRVAEGQALPFPDVIPTRGHAMEVRVYAEDPRTYLPASGTVLAWRPGPGVRVESGIEGGDEISPHYDPMLAKLIAWGETRSAAMRRLTLAVEETALLGVTSNLELLRHVLRHPEFAEPVDTSFLQRTPLGPPPPPPPAAVLAAVLTRHPDLPVGWRNSPGPPAPLRLEGHEVSLDSDKAVVDGQKCQFHRSSTGLELDGHYQPMFTAVSGDDTWVHLRQGCFRFRHLPLLPEPSAEATSSGSLRAPMPGKVLALLVSPGQEVRAGTALLKLEAMKMEHTVVAPCHGTVEALHCRAGDQVEAETVLVQLRSAPLAEEAEKGAKP